MRALIILGWAILLIASASAGAQAVVASSAFTYQGQLIDNNAPSNLDADLRFRLYDAEVAGNQVGTTVEHLAVSVVNGIFTVSLDFGSSVFDGNARWMQIDVRSPAGSGSYTAMIPRQEMTAVPYALHALNGGGSGGGQWQLVGSAITNTNVGNFVGINRSTPITSSEYFGIQTPTGSGAYGGMYVGTDASDGLPFYGYTTGTKTAWTYLDGGTQTWKLFNSGDRMTVDSAGVTEFLNNSGTPTVSVNVEGPTNLGGLIELSKADGTRTMVIDGAGGSGTQGGGISIFNDTNSSTATAVLDGEYGNGGGGALVLRNAVGATSVELGADFNPGDRGIMRFYQPDGTKTIEIDSEETGDPTQGGTIKLYDDSGALTIEMDADYGTGGEGRITTQVLEITGGSDLSEQFDVSGSVGGIKPGNVVSIDPASPGQLKVSSKSYDRCVAGIISGAGGVKTGMLMGQRGTAADGHHPVALTGRVYCKVDASYGPIEPGDLLTTSDTPGYAMKVTDHTRASGAILGKAMTALDSGRGEILVLVSLQ